MSERIDEIRDHIKHVDKEVAGLITRGLADRNGLTRSERDRKFLLAMLDEAVGRIKVLSDRAGVTIDGKGISVEWFMNELAVDVEKKQ